MHTQRKVFFRAITLRGDADIRFHSPQLDTSLHCKTINTEVVHRAMCLFMAQTSLVLIAPTRGGGWPD